MDKEILEIQSDTCKIFSNPKRIEILHLLRNGEKSVGEIVEATGVPKANISQHLAVLRDKGVVATRREGQTVYYRIANPKIIQACDLMSQVIYERLEESRKLADKLKSSED